jgi:hypothetical protein
MGNQEWTIQIVWQHMGHNTLDEDKKKKKKPQHNEEN